MGLRGPKADPTKPNSRTKSGGNRKVGSTAYNAAQLRKLEAGEPPKPGFLKGRAAEVWDDIVPALFKAELVHEVDKHMLAAYCMDMAEYFIKADALATLVPGRVLSKGEKPVTESERKALREEAKDAFTRARSLGEQFGMSTKSRTAMGIRMGGQADATGGGANTFKPAIDPELDFIMNGKRDK